MECLHKHKLKKTFWLTMLLNESTDSPWTPFGDLQTSEIRPNLVKINSSIWMSTDYNDGEQGMIEFDTGFNQIVWVVKYPKALRCVGHSLCVHNEIIYIIDGYNGEIWSFDPTAKPNLMFVKKSDIPKLGWHTNCFVREDRIYIMNGVDNEENLTFIYDISSNQFTKANVFDGDLKIGQSVEVKGDQCVRIGGCDVNFTKWSKLCSVGKINQFGIDWSKNMHLLPVGLAGCGLLWYKEFVLVFGGWMGDDSFSDAIYFYDVNKKARWKQIETLKCPLQSQYIAHLFDENVHLIAQSSRTKDKHFMIPMKAIMNQIKAENEEYDEKECDGLNERIKSLQFEKASLLVQLQSLQSENDDLRQSKLLLTKDVSAVQDECKESKAVNVELKERLESAQNKNDKIQKELNASQNECMELREQLKEFRILSIDPSNYLEWSGDEFVDWICGLDDGAFKQYEQKLRIAFKEEDISGSVIPFIQKEDWKGLGIKNFMHRTRMQAHIEELKQNQKNDNNYNYNDDEEGKETEYH